MRRDESGVAGFFEDLPVLAFVLGGVFLLISSAVWASSQVASEQNAFLLKDRSERATALIAQRIESLGTGDNPPDLLSIERSNLTQFVMDHLRPLCYSVNISSATSGCWWILLRGGDVESVSGTAGSSALVDARDEFGQTVVLKVVVVVWR